MKSTPLPYGQPIGIARSHSGPLPGVVSYREALGIIAENARVNSMRGAKRKATPTPTRTVAAAQRRLAATKRALGM